MSNTGRRVGPLRIHLLLLVSVFATFSVATESIEGTWQGRLTAAPGSELTIQFIIETADEGYTVTLNSPDSGAIKNVLADRAGFANGELTVGVTELSGAYSGALRDGEIVGHWQQLGQSLPLVMTRLVRLPQTDALRELVVGRWEGELNEPGWPTQTMELIFAIGDEGFITGVMGIPSQSSDKYEAADLSVTESGISLNVPDMTGSFKASFRDGKMAGEWSWGTPIPLTMTKKAFDPRSLAVELSDEARTLLLGAWFGYMETLLGEVPIVYRFEQTDDYIRGYYDSPDQGVANMPIRTVTLEADAINIAMNDFVRFRGHVDAGKLVGKFNQGNRNLPLILESGSLPPLPLDLPGSTELLGVWQGELQNPNRGSSAVIVRLERDPAGVVVGFVDRPDNNQKGMRIHAVTVEDDRVTIKLSEILRTSYSGAIKGDEISGIFTAGDSALELNLKRMNLNED